MIRISFYLVSKDVVERYKLLGARYVTKDGLYVIDNKDLSRMKANDIVGAVQITRDDAESLIRENNYSLE